MLQYQASWARSEDITSHSWFGISNLASKKVLNLRMPEPRKRASKHGKQNVQRKAQTIAISTSTNITVLYASRRNSHVDTNDRACLPVPEPISSSHNDDFACPGDVDWPEEEALPVGDCSNVEARHPEVPTTVSPSEASKRGGGWQRIEVMLSPLQLDKT